MGRIINPQETLALTELKQVEFPSMFPGLIISPWFATHTNFKEPQSAVWGGIIPMINDFRRSVIRMT